MSTKNPSRVLNLPIYKVLQQITNQVRNEAPELRITMKPRTLDTDTTWTSVLAEVIEALKPSDKKIMIGPERRRLEDRPESFREQLFPPGADLTKTSATGGLPIRTSFPAHIDLPARAPRTPEAQERLRKRAKEEMMAFGHRDPFVITKTATMYDRTVHTATQEIRDDEGVITISEYVEVDNVLHDPE